MNDVPHYRTRSGQRFYEVTMPDVARNLGRIADLLERLVVALERPREPARAPEGSR